MEHIKDQRLLKNWLLQPLLQIRLGIYSIILAAIFSLAIGFILYFSLGDFSEIVLALTDSESEVMALFESYLASTRWWIAIIVTGYFITTLSVSIVFTHRLVGPTVAFRNHIVKLRDGDYEGRITLRKGDAFWEVADELNKLTEVLAERAK